MQHWNQAHIYIHFFQFIASSLPNTILGPELQYSAFHLPKQPTRLTFFLFGNLWPVRSRMIKQLFYNLCMRLIMSHLTSHSSPWNFSFCYPFMSIFLFLTLYSHIKLLFSRVNEHRLLPLTLTSSLLKPLLIRNM